jgi:hypothetical protein
MPHFTKVQKMIGLASATLAVLISAGSAGYKLHNMYEDEPHILLAQQQMKREADSNVDKFLQYQRQQEIRQYEDDLDELKEKQRDGAADRYDLRKLDRYEKRIKQLERENNPLIPQG